MLLTELVINNGVYFRVFESMLLRGVSESRKNLLKLFAFISSKRSMYYLAFTIDQSTPLMTGIQACSFMLGLIFLLDLLLNSLFKPGYTPHEDHKHKYVYLLAYAASVHEIWDEVEISYN